MSFDFEHVELDNVSRHFGRRRVLSQITLQCRAGEIVGLLGQNGAGKSTLLSIVATLLRPSAGDVRYGGASVTAQPGHIRGRLGMLGHELQLYPELSARENLEFFARLQGLSDVASLVDAALERARLADRHLEPVSRFSRGMRQRVALERALLHDPRLVLLDEPFTGLDHDSVAALVARLRQLAAAGRIVLLATHDLDVVDGLLTRVVLLQNGRLANLNDGGGSLRARYAEAVNRSPARVTP